MRRLTLVGPRRTVSTATHSGPVPSSDVTATRWTRRPTDIEDSKSCGSRKKEKQRKRMLPGERVGDKDRGTQRENGEGLI